MCPDLYKLSNNLKGGIILYEHEHEHIKGMMENILDLMSQTLSLYSSIKQDNISEMNRASLNSIVQSKDNSLKSLYNEYKKVNPNYIIKAYTKSEDSPEILYNKIHSTEEKIISTIDKELLQNIPSKAHDGIYTIAQSIKSNSETSMIKLQSIINLRTNSSESYLYLIKTTHYIMKAMELYKKAGADEQLEYCTSILNENKRLMTDVYGKKLILYTPVYGDTYADISKNFGITLLQLVRENHIVNPYSKSLMDTIIIVIDDNHQ